MNDRVTMIDEDETADLVLRLRKDVAAAAKLMSRREARYLVDLYYQLQRQRMAADGQVRSMLSETGEATEPVDVLRFVADQARVLEDQARRALDLWTREHPLTKWHRSLVGIGPVIAAGFRAHLDEDPPQTAGKWWRFAGMDPTVTWNKGQKRPWNAMLKVLCWKAATSFVKFKAHDANPYGRLYEQRKAFETARSNAGGYAAQAAECAKRVGEDTEAIKHYREGRLSPGHLHNRALRWIAKMHLSHYHHVAFVLRYNAQPPKPFVIEHRGHVDLIGPPNWPMSSPS